MFCPILFIVCTPVGVYSMYSLGQRRWIIVTSFILLVCRLITVALISSKAMGEKLISSGGLFNASFIYTKYNYQDKKNVIKKKTSDYSFHLAPIFDTQ